MLEGKYFTTTITFDFRSCVCVREKLIGWGGEGEELWKGRRDMYSFCLFSKPFRKGWVAHFCIFFFYRLHMAQALGRL